MRGLGLNVSLAGMSIGVRFNFPSSSSSSSSLVGVLSPAVWKLSELDRDGLRLASGLEGVRIRGL